MGLCLVQKNDIVGKNIYLSYSFIFHDTQLKAPPLATMPFASQGTTSQSRYISFNCSIATVSLAIPICGTSKKLPTRRKLICAQLFIRAYLPYCNSLIPDFVNASPTRNRPVHKPQRECNISTTSRIGYGGAILFISHRVTRIKIITADYQVVTSAS